MSLLLFLKILPRLQSLKRRPNRGVGIRKKNGGQEVDMMGAAKINRTPIFREFMKYLSKGRTYAKRCPDLKKLLNSKEYKENEKLKIVQCELELMEHRINRSDYHALQFLAFKFGKNHGKKNNIADEDEANSEEVD